MEGTPTGDLPESDGPGNAVYRQMMQMKAQVEADMRARRN